MPRMTNTYMLGGDKDPAEIVASIKKGLYATNFGGGQVDIIGNSRLFGFKKTQIVYYDDSQKAAAEKMRDVLGIGEIIQSTQGNSALDLNITIGEDYLDRSGTTPDGGSGD
jgi:TldD protein